MHLCQWESTKLKWEKVKSLTMLFIIYANTILTQESDNTEINQYSGCLLVHIYFISNSKI